MTHSKSISLAAALVLSCSGALPAAEPPPENKPTAPPGSPYGVHSHVTRGDEHPFVAQEVKLMQRAGIDWLRTGFVWSALERKNDQWDFSRTDDVVARCEKAKIKIMGLLHGTPRWAEPTIDHLDEWLEFVRTTVNRYKGRVPAWQVWNEPNLDQFWKNPNPEHYATLLKATYRVIKEVDPQAIVVWGAPSKLDWRFLKPALAAAEGKFDVMAIHPYGYEDPRSPESYIAAALVELKRLLAKYGAGDKPIWFTEWGWPTHTGRRGMTDRQQGQYLPRAYLLAIHHGMERGFWYEFQERAQADEVNEDAFGILEYDLKPKPAYQAYATMITARPPGSVVLPTESPQGLIYHLRWRRPDGKIGHAIWNVWGPWNKPRLVDVKLVGKLAAAYDYLDKPVKLEVTDAGAATLPLGWGSPLYLIGPERVELQP